MKFSEQKLEGVYLIEPDPHEDQRGLLRRHFCQNEFVEHGLMTSIKQTNISENRKKLTLRGFHFQYPPNGENKVISCIKGSIYDIIVDLRKKSKTYLQWQPFELTEENRLSIYVPIGCANAYLTLQDNTWILYYHSEFYAPGGEGGVRYNDSFFKFDWPIKVPQHISVKDNSWPDFKLNS
jgi:dTDP-4-dehydrorhamnose 3,5-epimerase